MSYSPEAKFREKTKVDKSHITTVISLHVFKTSSFDLWASAEEHISLLLTLILRGKWEQKCLNSSQVQ